MVSVLRHREETLEKLGGFPGWPFQASQRRWVVAAVSDSCDPCPFFLLYGRLCGIPSSGSQDVIAILQVYTHSESYTCEFVDKRKTKQP